jgi:hypothetical protein
MLGISTKTLYNKLRSYEAGARWRRPTALADDAHASKPLAEI